jgi:hypothetical protein
MLWPEQWEIHYLPLNFLDRVNEPSPEQIWRFFTEPHKLCGLRGKQSSTNTHMSGSNVVDLRLDALSHQAQNRGVEVAIDKESGHSRRTRPFVSNRYSSTPPNMGGMFLGGRSCCCVHRFRGTLKPRCCGRPLSLRSVQLRQSLPPGKDPQWQERGL